MAFSPEDRCKVCQVIQAPGGQKLLKRIYKSRYFDSRGESLNSILQDYEGQFSYVSLRTHAKKHQALTEKQLTNTRLKHLQNALEAEKIKQIINHHDVRGLIMEKGYDDIKEGRVKLTASSIVGAAKQASDIEEKNKDRQVEVLKMIGAFAAGELKREDIDGSITSQQHIASQATVGHNPGADR